MLLYQNRDFIWATFTSDSNNRNHEAFGAKTPQCLKFSEIKSLKYLEIILKLSFYSLSTAFTHIQHPLVIMTFFCYFQLLPFHSSISFRHVHCFSFSHTATTIITPLVYFHEPFLHSFIILWSAWIAIAELILNFLFVKFQFFSYFPSSIGYVRKKSTSHNVGTDINWKISVKISNKINVLGQQ